MIASIKIKIKNIANIYLSTVKESRKFAVAFHLLLILAVSPALVYIAFFSPPKNFPQEILLSVEKGRTLNETAVLLEENNVIRSGFWFKKLVIIFKGENNIQAGDYLFNNPQNALEIAQRIIVGRFDFSPVKITVPEGLNVSEIARLLDKKLPDFDETKFMILASGKEGFLFPDTYYFSPKTKEKEIIETMEQNFYGQLSEISGELQNFNRPIEDVIKMASIVETESRTSESRRKIAGILWKRLEIGMPLQVDVTFKYINGKNSFELTSEDLKIDSPYNTYNRPGLPPTAIANPGLQAILATINPAETDYLYFLSDRSGNMHYARTFDEHVANKKRYLNLQ